MDRIDIYAGGQAISKQDLDFLQNAIRDTFIQSNGLLSNSYIISGCKFTGDTVAGWALTEGYLVLNGELCKVDTTTYPANPLGFLNPSFVIAQSVAKQKVNKDGVTRDVRIVRKATVVETLDQGVPLFLMDNVWRTVGNDDGETTLAAGFSHLSGSELQYKRMGKKVYLRGVINHGGTLNSAFTVFTLPDKKNFAFTNSIDAVGYRPSRKWRRTFLANNGDDVLSLYIDSNGEVGCDNSTLPTIASVYFDGVCFDLV